LYGRQAASTDKTFSGVSTMALMVVLVGLAALLGLAAWIGWGFYLPSRMAVVEGHELQSSSCCVNSLAEVFRCLVPRGQLLGYLAMGLVVGGIGVFGVLSVSGSIGPDPLAIREWGRQAHIQKALNPEYLAPPPAFPPSFFVGSGREDLEAANRDWNRLDPRFLQPVLELLRRLERRGYVFALLEGYRSPERQEVLADKGAHVTNARAYQSKHQFGLAVDLAPVRDGRLVISERDPRAMEAYQVLGEEAEKAGMVWGGRWWLKDYGHVEAGAF
jgi:peptidoglycan L-alanyl-D-glutamate endopeptidase CwlK